jgi:hypothetical protein
MAPSAYTQSPAQSPAHAGNSPAHDTSMSCGATPAHPSQAHASMQGRSIFPAIEELLSHDPYPDSGLHPQSRPLFSGSPVTTSIQQVSTGSNGSPPTQVLKKPASKSPAKDRFKWAPEEDSLITELRGQGRTWKDIAKSLPGRSSMSCRLRYQNYLEKRVVWDEEKKTKLALLYARYVKREIPIGHPPSQPCWRLLLLGHTSLSPPQDMRFAGLSSVGGIASCGF